MANVSEYLEDILSAVYGEEVRGSIHDAIEAVNAESEECVEKVEAYLDPATVIFQQAMHEWGAEQQDLFDQWFATLTQDLTMQCAVIQKRLSQVGNGVDYTYDFSSIATAIGMNDSGYVFLYGTFTSFETSYSNDTLTINTSSETGRVARGRIKIYVNGFLMPDDTYTITVDGTDIDVSFTNSGAYDSNDVIEMVFDGICNGIV